MWRYSIIVFVVIFSGCSADSGDSGSSADASVLSTIGDRTIVSGNTLTFTVNATDPNDLPLVYDSDGSVGVGPNPFEMGASFQSDTGQFSWDTTGAITYGYTIRFSVMNAAGLSDSETIRISVQTQQSLYAQGQSAYNSQCVACHRNEDANPPSGSASILCRTPGEITLWTGGFATMPAISVSAANVDAISYYLNNVRPSSCI